MVDNWGARKVVPSADRSVVMTVVRWAVSRVDHLVASMAAQKADPLVAQKAGRLADLTVVN
jgi:hypothetical protein